MIYPWEKPAPVFHAPQNIVERLPNSDAANIGAGDYVTFMNTHVRVSVTVNGEKIGTFAVLDDGTDMNVQTIMPDGEPLIFKVEGHPRTTDKMVTLVELVDYVLTAYKR